MTENEGSKRIKKKYTYRFCCAVIFTILVSAMFFGVWYPFAAANNQTEHLLGIGNLGMALGLYFLLYIIFGRAVRAFRIGIERKAGIVAAQVIALFLTDFVEIFLSLAITGEFRFFWDFAWRYMLLWLAQSIIISCISVLMINIYRRRFPPLQLLEIYGDYENEFYKTVNEVYFQYHVEERRHYSDWHEGTDLSGFDAVLVNDIPAKEENDILKECFAKDKRVYFVPKISDIIKRHTEDLNLFDTPLFLCRNNGPSEAELGVKRFFDLLASLLALIVFSPIFAVTALAIKLNDGGPVFFRQERCTIGGKRFMIIKFRSMIVNAEIDGRSHPAGEHDDRITKVGKVIRATRIDELPQFINILKGDMSLIGPRPERVEHVMKYTEDIPEFAFRSKMRGGLTGYAQVYGKYNTSALDKIKMDLIYITNFSLLLDFQIIMETLKIIVRKESTEGFSKSQVSEMHDYKMPKK